MYFSNVKFIGSTVVCVLLFVCIYGNRHQDYIKNTPQTDRHRSVNPDESLLTLSDVLTVCESCISFTIHYLSGTLPMPHRMNISKLYCHFRGLYLILSSEQTYKQERGIFMKNIVVKLCNKKIQRKIYTSSNIK